MSDPRRDLSPEEIAALEAELDRITVDDVLLQTVVSLLNLGARKAGLGAPPGPDGPSAPPDLEQLRQAIEGARALLPLLETRHAAQLGPVRETVARLQMAYAQLAGESGGVPAAAPDAPGPAPVTPGPAPARPQPQAPGAGDAQRSGRLWIPGQ